MGDGHLPSPRLQGMKWGTAYGSDKSQNSDDRTDRKRHRGEATRDEFAIPYVNR